MPTTYAIPDGRVAMAATTFTGVSGAVNIVNTVNGVGFQPDFTWTKSRSNAQDNYAIDSVRGGSNLLRVNTTGAESNFTSPPWVTSFNSNGYSSDSASLISVGYTYVGWQWKAGGTAVSNTAGSITSSVSANTTAGFSVVTFTGNATAGSTVGHGLGVAPQFVIYKGRNNANDWWSYHVGLTSAAYAIQLNTTNAQNNTVNFFNSTAPNSSVLTLGYWSSPTGFNNSGVNYVAYCFAPVAGYSAFGSYTGNGSADGPFVYLGFKPRYVMVKRTDAAGYNWEVFDTTRSTYNVDVQRIFPNDSSAELTGEAFDMVSNGFKCRLAGNSDSNASGGTYIYYAVAENPFKYANAR